MDQKFPFLGPKEIGPKFLENKTKQTPNKKQQQNQPTKKKNRKQFMLYPEYPLHHLP